MQKKKLRAKKKLEKRGYGVEKIFDVCFWRIKKDTKEEDWTSDLEKKTCIYAFERWKKGKQTEEDECLGFVLRCPLLWGWGGSISERARSQQNIMNKKFSASKTSSTADKNQKPLRKPKSTTKHEARQVYGWRRKPESRKPISRTEQNEPSPDGLFLRPWAQQKKCRMKHIHTAWK